jgi:hypothetical protein
MRVVEIEITADVLRLALPMSSAAPRHIFGVVLLRAWIQMLPMSTHSDIASVKNAERRFRYFTEVKKICRPMDPGIPVPSCR